MDRRGSVHKRVNILVIDDSPELIQQILPEYGFNVNIANDGENAQYLLKKSLEAEQEKPDLILLDILMPKMNGWEVLKFIRENQEYKYIPIIMMSVLTNEIDLISSLKLGADDYICKPFNMPTLIARLEALLRRSNWSKKPNIRYNINQENDKCILTLREKEIIDLLGKGHSNKKIAEKLFLSELTVKTHLKNIFKKLNANNRTQAILIAMNKGIISENCLS